MSSFNGSSNLVHEGGPTSVCLEGKQGNFYSKGYFMGDDPFAFVLPVFMFQLVMFFTVSRLIYFILKPLKQPKFISNVLGGIILGPSFLGRRVETWDFYFPREEALLVNTLCVFGGVYFIFIIALGMETKRILRMAKNAWNVGIVCLIVPFALATGVAYLLNHHFPGIDRESYLFFLSSVLSLTYFAVVAHAITELNLLTSELGQLAMSCALLHELVGWFDVALSATMKEGEKTQVIYTAICMLALLLFTILILRPAVLWIIETTPEGKPVKEIYIVTILAGVLVMGTLTDALSGSYMPGAMLMGLVIPAGQPLGSALIDKCEIVISNFFLPFFYIRLGQLTNVFTITDWTAFAALELIVVASYLGKFAGSLLSSLFFKMSLRNALVFGSILNLRGVMDLIVLLRWKSVKVVDEQSFTILVFSHLFITAILTPLITIFYKPEIRLEEDSPMEIFMMKSLQTTPIKTELRILCCIHREDSVHSFITLLKAFNPTQSNPICAYVVHLVELVGRAAPLLVPYNTQKRKTRVNSTDRIMSAMTKYAKTSHFPVTIQPYTLIAPYKTMHESICKLAQDKYTPLILAPFHQRQTIERRITTLRNINISIQAYAPCTVGVFVDRGFPRNLSSTYFSYKVAVFFLGGPDDRESMALVSRMSGNPDTSITLFRIFYDLNEADEDEDENERFLDDIAVNEFMSSNLGNGCVVCHEKTATSSSEVMDAIHSAENDYDLVIVGKRRAPKSKLEKELKPWVDYQELGVIGDMLASQDFCGGMVPVLVIQCARGVDESIISELRSCSQDKFSSLGT